ncbi:hypothetical protein ACFOU2_19750 [Bacillus songklensis]|uniref:Tetratricopeptide repeat protein n=1 Tax=Bacillus songklensis TaxID=1069116 RepID=A0ABV8B6S8_9BACI
MTVFLGPGVHDWPANGPQDIVWLSTAPVVGSPIYPICLDVAESALAAAPSSLIRAVCDTLAPTWDELQQFGLTTMSADAPTWDDVKDIEYDVVDLQAVLAQYVGSLGPGFGVILRHPQRYDITATQFVLRLIHQAKRTGFHVAIEAPYALARDSHYQLILENFTPVPMQQYNEPLLDVNDLATQLVAICPHGIPIWVLERLGVSFTTNTCVGPAGEPWAFLSVSNRLTVLKHLSSAYRRELSARLFDEWSPDGWGYLRRAGHAIAAADQERMLAHHIPYLYGIKTSGRFFLFKHYVGLLKSFGTQDRDFSQILSTLVSAARLAPRIELERGFEEAVGFYEQALQICTDPVKRVELIYEVANIYAGQRKPEYLVKSRHWYKLGYEALSNILNLEDRVRSEIQLANGLALVEYHEHHNGKALRLELHAQSLAGRVARQFPNVERWATPLLNFNMAKLLEKRFSDIPSAMKLLEKNVALDDYISRERALAELARLYFTQGEYRRVVDLLTNVFEKGVSIYLTPKEEFMGRSILTVSLLVIGDTNRLRYHLHNLNRLADTLNSSKAEEIVDKIRKAYQSIA